MSEISTKPYLLRAIYEWCTDNGYTPYLAVMVDGRTRVPREFVKNGEIVLNISFSATSGLKMDNDAIFFSARFGGVSQEIHVPVDNVIAIYSRENGQGMAFEVQKPGAETAGEDSPVVRSGPSLSAVSTTNEARADAQSEDMPGDDPDPPKKGSRPTLTRIK